MPRPKQHVPKRPVPRGNIETIKKRSLKQENELANRFNGKRTPASGALGMKGDVHFGECICEAKTTSFSSFRVSENMLQKIEQEATDSLKEPVFIIQFEQTGNQVAIISLAFFEKLLKII